MSTQTELSTPSQPSIFPLPLEPFEEYMVRDERPCYPMVIPLILRFQGRIDRPAMQRALEEVLANEPLLTSCLVRRKGRYYWVSSGQSPIIRWEDVQTLESGENSTFSGQTLDLSQQPGMRVAVEVAGERVTIKCDFHHACTDGLGCFQFIANWLARYGQLIGDDEGLDGIPPEPELTPQRAELDIELPEPLTKGRIVKSTILEVYKFLTRRPQPLAAKNRKDDPPHDAPILLWRRLDSELVGKLRAYAKQRKTGINDVFIRDMFLTIRDWNTTWGKTKQGQHLRILMPVNLRKRRHRKMPSVNVLGYGFLTQTIRDCSKPEELLRNVSQEIKEIRYWSAGAMFLDSIRFFQRIPFALQLMTSKRSCHATCVLSNVGAIHQTMSQRRYRREKTIRVGDLVLEDLLIAPPVRPQTWGSIGIVRHGETITLSLNADLNQVSQEQAHRFLDAYCDRLKRSANESE